MRLEDRFFRALFFGQASTFACLIYLIFLDPETSARNGVALASRFIAAFLAPAANAIYVSAAVCLITSALYLKSPSSARNAWARASAECASAFGALSVVNGILITKYRSGVHWSWVDHQSIAVLLIVLVFGALVVFRSFGGDGDSERKFAAALGILGAVNLPLIHWAVELWSPVKSLPAPVQVVAEIKLSAVTTNMVALGHIATASLLAMLLWSRARLAHSSDRVAEVEQELASLSPS